MGVVESFSLRNAIAGSLTTAATAGIGAYINSSAAAAAGTSSGAQFIAAREAHWLSNPLVRGASSYASSVVARAATGQDTAFSWAAVAASSVGAGVGRAVGNVLPDSTNTLFSGFVEGVSSGAAADGIAHLIDPNLDVNPEGIAISAAIHSTGTAFAQADALSTGKNRGGPARILAWGSDFSPLTASGSPVRAVLGGLG